jgi:hypothetical protein
MIGAEAVNLITGNIYRLTWTDPNYSGCPGLRFECPEAEYTGSSRMNPPEGATYVSGGLELHTFTLRADTRQTAPDATDGCTWAAIGEVVNIAAELLTVEGEAE